MGARDMNFHKEVFARMGYEREAQEIQDLFFAGKRDEAITKVPDQMVLDQGILGSPAEIRDQLPMWAEAGYTTMLANASSLDEMRQVAEVVLG
jgi:alkanesulfonate monooxygenase SsuD/methylene tetrahydromethanopterin reductase-like flavin-dependent oxidoreductase (luciferase family)